MNENFDHQHQDLRTENAVKYGDLPEFMDFEYLRKIAASNLATLANLAWAPKRLQMWVSKKDLTNFSTLVWKAADNKKAYGYQVLLEKHQLQIGRKRYL
jgi:hypothetical protein